ncbi:MAG: nucleotidyl transferase AbiEii/AbiGii toxin family protein [Tannerellaceae bacterium]|nr:nucleotidyl transferase AbiEii/AbiGii toxin family protein [Tannerellaceae bacterium]
MDNLFLTQEGFIRRAAIINDDFMLKGSFVTRQYFSDPTLRKPADLDWVYLGAPLHDALTAEEIFNTWATKVTECKADDSIRITSFQENPFWRMIDYAMDDDFPTVNTDLTAITHSEKVDFSLDISFNLDPELPPVGIMYKPAQGNPFYLSKTTAPGNQIAWKLHQTIVRMRFKDLFDLYFMLQNEAFDENVLIQALQIYVNECGADKKDPTRIHYLINGEWEKLLDVFTNSRVSKKELLLNTWNIWRNNEKNSYDSSKIFDCYSSISHITDYTDVLPVNLELFKNSFSEVCVRSGLAWLCQHLPENQKKQRTKFWGLFG